MKKTGSDSINAINSTRIGRRNAAASLEPTTTLLTDSKDVTSEHRIQTIAERFPAAEEQPATFAYFDPKAKAVCVAGSFNDWRPDATPLKNSGTGEWAVELMLKPGKYEYRFVVDGRWVDNPRTPDRVANPYGGFNSVLTLNLEVRTFFL